MSNWINGETRPKCGLEPSETSARFSGLECHSIGSDVLPRGLHNPGRRQGLRGPATAYRGRILNQLCLCQPQIDPSSSPSGGREPSILSNSLSSSSPSTNPNCPRDSASATHPEVSSRAWETGCVPDVLRSTTTLFTPSPPPILPCPCQLTT